MERILVIGSCGAGKSVLAKTIAERLELPLVHLDREYWLPGWKEPPKHVWKQRVDELIARPRWVIDGNYGGTLRRRLKRADGVVFLDLPTWRCIAGVLTRVAKHRGQTRADMGPECPERLDLDFLRYVARFRRDKRPAILAALREHSDARVFPLRSRGEMTAFAKRLGR